MNSNRLLSALAAGWICTPLLTLHLKAEPDVQLDEMIIRAPAEEAMPGRILADDRKGGSVLNAAELATQSPGVSAVRRGANAAEPVIRGLGWERVATQAGSHVLYGSCPSRMDPPGTYISPESVESIQVVKGIPSVTLGAGATGGRLILDTDYDRGPDAEPGYEGKGEILYNEGREGFSTSLGVEGGSRDLDIKAGVNIADFGDYESADGTTVPAGIVEYGGALSLGWRPNDHSRGLGHFQYKRAENVDFPSLPMDTEESESTLVTLGYRDRPVGGSMDRLEIHLGYSHVDHLMNNKEKSNRKKLIARTPSTADTVSTRLDADWQLSGDTRLTLGLDGEYLEREAVRTRIIRATGATFKDAIWPEVDQRLLGLFSELNWNPSDALHLRTGVRVDHAASDANTVDEMIVLGPGNAARIRDRYLEFNGPDADRIDRDEVLVSGNAVAEWGNEGPWSTHLGVGRTERYPAVTELYFAFAPAPGGFLVGNPGLDTEKKYEIDAGIRYHGDTVKAGVSAFASYVEDYILQTGIQRSDLNGDGAPDLLRGFRNVDAELYGGEVDAEWVITDHWSLPATLAYVRGRNTDDRRDLPEIPPLSGDLGLHYQARSDARTWSTLGISFAMRQDKVDSDFPEDETPSFTVWHFRAGRKLTRAIAIEAGIENLFDEDYHEHLTREAVLATDDLKAGDEIPAIGRYVYAKASCSF